MYCILLLDKDERDYLWKVLIFRLRKIEGNVGFRYLLLTDR